MQEISLHKLLHLFARSLAPPMIALILISFITYSWDFVNCQRNLPEDAAGTTYYRDLGDQIVSVTEKPLAECTFRFWPPPPIAVIAFIGVFFADLFYRVKKSLREQGKIGHTM